MRLSSHRHPLTRPTSTTPPESRQPVTVTRSRSQGVMSFTSEGRRELLEAFLAVTEDDQVIPVGGEAFGEGLAGPDEAPVTRSGAGVSVLLRGEAAAAWGLCRLLGPSRYVVEGRFGPMWCWPRRSGPADLDCWPARCWRRRRKGPRRAVARPGTWGCLCRSAEPVAKARLRPAT